MLLAVFLGLASTLLSGLVLATPLDSAASQERSLDDALDFTLLARGSTSYSAVFRLRTTCFPRNGAPFGVLSAWREQTMTVIKRGSDDWSFDLTPIPDLAVAITRLPVKGTVYDFQADYEERPASPLYRECCLATIMIRAWLDPTRADPLVKIAKSSISMNCGGKAVRSPELCQGVQVEYCKSPTAEMELETSSSSG